MTQAIDLDVVVAAAVHDAGGRLEVTAEAIEADYSDLAMAISYDNEKDVLVLSLVPKDVVVYDDAE